METIRKLKNCQQLIKNHLKQNNISYQQLSAVLNVSLLTVKRQLNGDDIAFSKLLDLCDASGCSLSELLLEADKQVVTHTFFTAEQDLAFCRHPSLFLYFSALFYELKSPEEIATEYALTRASSHIYLRKLETIGLISLSAKGSVSFLVQAPLGFSEDSQFAYKDFENALIEVSGRLAQSSKNEDYVLAKPMKLPDELRHKMLNEVYKVVSSYSELSERFYNESNQPLSALVVCGYKIETMDKKPEIENVVKLD